VKFSRDATEVAFAAREFIAGKDARTLATEVLAMDDEQFRTAFRKSPIKRAKLRGLKRNALVVLDTVASARNAPTLATIPRDAVQAGRQAHEVSEP
jgi:epoxyqueuosine reductase QueG